MKSEIGKLQMLTSTEDRNLRFALRLQLSITARRSLCNANTGWKKT